MATATVTNAYVLSIMQAQDGTPKNLDVSYFKIGEGGWETSGASQVPRTPDPTLTDVDAIENPARYPADSRYVFQKSISADKISITGADTIEVECYVDSGEANDDGFGNSPEFFEVGIFDSDNTMICYLTFEKQTKDDRRALRHTVTIQRTIV